MSIQSNFPAIKPTLLLDFANVEQLDPRITFTRASTATYFDQLGVMQTAASGVARFDHNPTTFESLGLLIEEQRTNTTNYSEQFDNNWWVETRSTITADVIVSPDGTVDADKLIEDTTASNTHYIRSTTYSTVSGTSYTWSIFLKAGERTKARVALQMFLSGSAYPTTNPRVDVDLVTGTLSNANGTIATSITNAGNGWYRVAVSATANANAADQFAGVFLLDGAGEQTYTGDGTSGLYIWGAQLEVGAFVSSYIQTVASQVTRAADAASMTGTNFSSWYNQAQGTVFSDVVLSNTPASVSCALYYISDGTTSERIAALTGTGGGGNINTVVTTGGVLQAQTINGSLATVGNYKHANAYRVNDFASVVNGSPAAVDTSGTLPVVDRLNIGASQTGLSLQINGTIKKFAYYPFAATSAQLQGLTS